MRHVPESTSHPVALITAFTDVDPTRPDCGQQAVDVRSG